MLCWIQVAGAGNDFQKVHRKNQDSPRTLPHRAQSRQVRRYGPTCQQVSIGHCQVLFLQTRPTNRSTEAIDLVENLTPRENKGVHVFLKIHICIVRCTSQVY